MCVYIFSLEAGPHSSLDFLFLCVVFFHRDFFVACAGVCRCGWVCVGRRGEAAELYMSAKIKKGEEEDSLGWLYVSCWGGGGMKLHLCCRLRLPFEA